MRTLPFILSTIAVLSPYALHSNEVFVPENKPICTRPFPLEPTTYTFSSTHGDICVWDSGGTGKAVLFIHGNSCCKEVFTKQFNSDLTKKYRFIALDLPGHGQSAKAINPEKTYCLDGYSDVLIELIKELRLENPFVVGWSLGGHVALNALAKGQTFAATLITGTPPIEITYQGFQKGWLPIPEIMHLWGKEKFTTNDANLFIKCTNLRFDLKKDSFILDAVLKTDGLCRSQLAKSMGTKSVANQRTLVETNNTPLCIIQGTEDRVNLDYLKNEVKYKNLFNGKIYEIEGAGHAVFWEEPEIFNAIVADFFETLSK